MLAVARLTSAPLSTRIMLPGRGLSALNALELLRVLVLQEVTNAPPGVLESSIMWKLELLLR